MRGRGPALDMALREALAAVRARTAKAGARADVDERRIVFAALVATMARARGRVGNEVSLADWLVVYRLDGAPAHPDVRESVERAERCLREVKDSVAPETIIAAYEQSLAWGARDADARHSAGAYFTPPDIAERLLDQALSPALREAESSGAEELLDLRLCDPACGPGVFLLAALRRIAPVLARRAGMSDADAAAHVARHALHGVDLDVGAVELARALVWLETSLPWEELPSLHGFRAGNSLLGATPVRG
jgi:hypothetical protein